MDSSTDFRGCFIKKNILTSPKNYSRWKVEVGNQVSMDITVQIPKLIINAFYCVFTTFL